MTEQATAKRIVEIMTKSNGANAASRAVIAKLNDRPPYSQEELEKTPFSAWRNEPPTMKAIRDQIQFILTGRSAPRNPHGTYCPLCRRRTSVEMVADAGREGVEYKCHYSGCKGYEWSE